MISRKSARSTGYIALLGVLALLSACGGSTTQFEVKAEDKKAVELAGDWKGSYVGVDSGRKGEISFSLTLGRHTAEGQVLMYPVDAPAKPQPLDIRFAEIGQNGEVRGTMTPYTDPQCKCQVTTEFNGVIENDRIEGTFTTQAVEAGLTQTGRWWVERQN